MCRDDKKSRKREYRVKQEEARKLNGLARPSFEQQTEVFCVSFIKASLVLAWEMVLRVVGRVWDSAERLWRGREEVRAVRMKRPANQ